MNWQTECAAVIPCRNEGGRAGEVATAVRRLVPSVIVVDDGSVDDTARVCRQAGAEVISLRKPMGKGAALAVGWSRARARGFTWAICLDGDGQHSPAHIPAFLNCAEITGADLVVGNRMGQAGEMPRVRRVANRWMSRSLSRLSQQDLPDSQCGYRLMHLDGWSKLQLRTRHFEVESEVLLAFLRAGARVRFVPIDVIYREERSKIRPLTDTWRWLCWWLRARRFGRKGTLVPSSESLSGADTLLHRAEQHPRSEV